MDYVTKTNHQISFIKIYIIRFFLNQILLPHYIASNREIGLVGFYGISTIVGYSMPNPVFTYILNI